MAIGAPTLTAKSVPVPGVEVYFSSLGTGTPTSITVYRLANGVTTQVRSAVNAAASGAYTVTDYEAPFGVVTTYWAETFNSAGTSLGLGSTATITLAISNMWIHDPIDPTNNIEIALGGLSDATLGKESFNNIAKTYKYNRSMVLGSSKPVLQFYGQKAIEGAQFEVFTKDTKNSTMDGLLGVAPLCIRVPAVMLNLPSTLYGVMEAVQEPQTWRFETAGALTRWALTFNETASQSLSIVFNYYSYTYWNARYATYNAANAVWGTSTYVSAIRNPPA